MHILLILIVIFVLIVAFVYLLPLLSRKNRIVSAAGQPDITQIKKLIDAGGDPNSVGIMGVTPLICAIQNKRRENVSFLLENGANPKGTAGKHSPLIAAIDENDLDMAELLLKAGADPNQSGLYGRSAMVDATVEGKVDFVKLLFRNGGQIDRKWPDNDGIFFQLLVDAVKERNPQKSESLRGITATYLENGANPNGRKSDDTPAIGIAMQNLEILKLLVDHGAIIDIEWKGTPLKVEVTRILDSKSLN